MTPSNTSVHTVEVAPQHGCCQCLCPEGEPQPPLASLGDSPRPAGRSDPCSYQIVAFALGPGACEILCAPCKSEVSIFLSPLELPKLSPTGLPSHMLWEFVFPEKDPWAGDPNVGLRTLMPVGEPLQYNNYSPVCGSPPGGYGI